MSEHDGNPPGDGTNQAEGDGPRLEELVAAALADADFHQVDALAGALTERLAERAEAYWRARTNDIFVRNHPELVQQLVQVDATNLQTVVLARGLEALRKELARQGQDLQAIRKGRA